MDIALLIFGFICMLIGIIGSFLPVLPGPPISWIGLLLLFLTSAIPQDWWFLGITVGLIVAIVFPILGIFGIVIWPFVGAYVGEIMNKANKKTALKAAFGSFLGFLTGTFLKFMVAIVYLGLFISKAWEYKSALFPYF